VIDRKLLLHDFDNTAARLARKGVTRAELQACADGLRERASLTGQVDEARSVVKSNSKQIGAMMREGRSEEAAALKQTVAAAKQRITDGEERLRVTEAALEDGLLGLPNFPDEAVPDGVGDVDNIVLRTHGPDPESFAGRGIKPHWEIASALGIYDGERGAKVSGSMFAILAGHGARLLRALVQLGLDLNRDTYTEMIVPHIVNRDTFTATGQLPKFAEDAYHVDRDDLWAIPTGEVPLMGMHRGEILDEKDLPKRYMTYTACFRREAGSAGKDTRGMQRVHEFHKVELVKLCTEENVETEHAMMLADAEKPLRLLGLPYRVVEQCTGDLPFSATRVRDLEVFAPGVGKWLEVASVGTFSDFQARRGNIRYRPRDGGKLRFVHALNGSAMATPRIWSSILEVFQQEDGTVVVPEPLRESMGSDVLRPV
jgi:seryl-tRNA synthetase